MTEKDGQHVDITENSAVENIEGEPALAEQAEETAPAAEACRQEAEKKLKETEEKLLRQAADHDNRLKRLAREMDEKIKYANQALLTSFLPVLDSFDLALKHLDGADTESLAEGARLNAKLLQDTLEKAGLAVIPVQRGEPFNPALHEGIMLGKEEGLPDGSVIMVAQNGYKLGDRVIRPSKVQVNKL